MKIILPFILLCVFSSILFSQTVIPGGNISGTWTFSGSPYLIQGNILVPNGTLLTIEPGVVVNFQGSYKLQVSGRLVAAGNAADSIRFTATDNTTGWQGIRFDNTAPVNDSSKIAFCSISYGYIRDANGGGVFINNFSKISVTHSSISNCIANQGRGGAIYVQSSGAVITDNKISYNHSIAGGIFIQGGNPFISNNNISFNDNELPPFGIGDPGDDPDNYGGGISCFNSNAIIINNTITQNISKRYGGGIVSYAGSPTISSNIITNNHSVFEGGGIYCTANLTLTDNSISGNSSDVSGGGIYYFETSGGNPLFNKNNIVRNTAAFSGGGFVCYAGKATITGNLISNNSLSALAANYQGGGGLCIISADTTTVVSNNIISNNNAPNGGGILCYNSKPKLSGNTISNNSAVNGGALNCVIGSPSLLNMILWGNTASASGSQVFLYDDQSIPAITYSDIAGGAASFSTNENVYSGNYQNNIDTDPLFVSPSTGSGTAFDGAVANWSLKNSSPCRDTGKPGTGYLSVDYSGNLRVVNGIIDMGALENQTPIPPTATVSGGGQACVGAQTPSVVFTFTYGTFPFTLQYSINGMAQTPISGINELQYILPDPAPGVYTVNSITDALSTGTGIGSATVTIVRPVAGFLINDDRQCLQGNNFAFTNISSTNFGSLASTWNFDDDSLLVINNPNHSYSGSGTYLVRLIVSVAGCADTISKPVNVTSFFINPLQDTVKTYLDSLVLNAGSGFSNYNWSTGDTVPVITVKHSGWYKVTVINSDGCSAKDSSYVNFGKNKTLFIDKKQNLCTASSFDLSVRTKGITNVIGLQGTISWNEGVMQLDSVLYNNSAIHITAPDLNLTNKANGYLTYSWSDNTLAGKSVPDSTGIFTLRFSKNYTGSAIVTPVIFSSLHTILEIDTVDLSTNAPVTATETDYVNGAAAFRQGGAVSSFRMADCDSVVYNNRTYYDSATVYDTIKYNGSQCDSIYKIVYIDIYRAVTPAININTFSNSISYGTSVQFNAGISFGGQFPLIQWYKNGIVIPGENGITYTSSTLNAGDTVYAILKSSFTCKSEDSVRSNSIGMTVTYNVSGVIQTSGGIPVQNPEISITGYLSQNFSGNSSGNYAVVLPGGNAHNYVIRPSKNNDVNKTNGVSTLDIAIIQSHILNSTLFTSPYQWIAADVNKSNTVTSIDILFIKRLILGLDNSFPGNSLWAFIDTVNAPLNPLHPLPYKDSIRLPRLLADKPNQNFIAVKLGDVNFDWNSSLLKPAEPNTVPVNFYYNDVYAQASAEIRVPVRVKNFRNILGLQFTLNFNSAALQLKAIENNRLSIQYDINKSGEGKIPFIWNDDNNILSTLIDDDVLMELVFVKKAPFTEEDIHVTSDITAVEAWDGEYKKHSIVKSAGRIINSPGQDMNFEAEHWTVTPDPTTGIVQLNVYLLKEKNIRIDLMSADGKIFLTQKIAMPKGAGHITLDLQKNNTLAAGSYNLKLSGIENGAVKKIVILK